MSDRLLLTGQSPCHTVYFYQHIEELTRTVTRFVADGLAVQQPTFVVARSGLRHGLVDALGGMGLDVAVAEREERLFLLDADSALESLRVGGRLDADRARTMIKDMFIRLPEAFRRGPTRVFGEMCGMLWHSGHYLEAMQLEDLDGIWNTPGITTLCSYSLEQSERSAQDAICTFHTHRLSTGGALEALV